MTWTLVAQITVLILVSALATVAVAGAIRGPRAPRG
jgi:hypothetical protein